MNTVFLESPFGTIRYRFHSQTQAAVSLLEPSPVVVNGVKVEGVLQFKLTSRTWVYLKHDSYVDRTDNHKAASETIQNKLTGALTTLLNDWYGNNLEAFKAVKVALLGAKLKEEEAELNRLLERLEQQKAVVNTLKQQLESLH